MTDEQRQAIHELEQELVPAGWHVLTNVPFLPGHPPVFITLQHPSYTGVTLDRLVLASGRVV